jgi:calcineurin-like phosphoesterase family protein
VSHWLTSDTHFGHFNILKYCSPTRPFKDLDEMHAQLIARWNDRVGAEDEVIVVGDMIATRRPDRKLMVGIMQMLNGRKTLVRGNHDPDTELFLEGGFVDVVDHIWMPESRILVIHKVPDPKWGPAELRIAQALQPAIVVHGHDHRHETPEHPGCLNVCADRWNLEPVPWEAVLSRLPVAATEAHSWAARK